MNPNQSRLGVPLQPAREERAGPTNTSQVRSRAGCSRRALQGGADPREAGGGERAKRLRPRGWGARDSAAAARRVRGAHGPVARSLGKICQGCASRAHQGCGSLPEPSSFVIATVNQRLKTESDPKGRAETGLVGKKRGASGERSLPEVGRSAAQKLRMRTVATARGISAGSRAPGCGLCHRCNVPQPGCVCLR